MESFTNGGPSDADARASGSRRVEFQTVEARAFIGRWSDATSSFESLRPRATRPVAVTPPAPPSFSSIACDIVIAVSALLMIFCIPGLIIYAAMGH